MEAGGGAGGFLYRTDQGCAAGIGILFMLEIYDKVSILSHNYINNPYF